MIHLVCGPLGAGKTTFAHKIAEQFGAIRFSEDEWLSTLFVPDAPPELLAEPAEVIAAWASENYQRCRSQIDLVCRQLLQQGMTIVLDGAAANKTQRDRIRQKADDHKVGFQLHYITSSKTVRRKRVFHRNTNKGQTYAVEVTPTMFDFMETFFEPPIREELIGANIVRT